ncbi:MAG TPA: tRNA lysidine(34) synthetase TilS [Verrucomicrobiae bacterium]|nr:tRNA lysidine(34) synthetase TilS [Verrucomicrobiae bacterium]
MSQFLQHIEDAVNQRRLLVRGQKILVAVSGGVDSMVLLHSLHLLAKKSGWEIFVAHYNHRLRGRASEADEKLVQQTAVALGLGFFDGGSDVKKIAERSNISIEMASRKLRHEFLARTAKEHNISTIAVAHHADDQVELFFVRLLRGAGGVGLAGMKWLSPSPADRTLSLIRPLLNFSKAELLAFAREKKIQYRNDATNFSADFLRNRIRNELLPLLHEDYQPGLDKTVLRLMDIVGAEAEFASDAAKGFCAGIDCPAPAELPNGELACAGASQFDELAVAVQRKAVQQQLTGLGLVPDFDLIEQLRITPGKKITVSPGMSVSREATGKVCSREELAGEFSTAEHELKISGKTGRGEFGRQRFRWRLEPMKQFQPPRKKTGAGLSALREVFDADKIGGEIILRHWRPGDRFQPIGLKSPVKLQDLFVNAKIPSLRRRELVLATTKTGDIFWVEGLRIGEQFKLTPQTRWKLVWQPKYLKKHVAS